MAFDRTRIAFGPEALSRFTQIIEEVHRSWLAMAFPPHRCDQPKCAQGWPRDYSAWLALVDRYSN